MTANPLFLLGAGASANAELPMAREITRLMLNELNERPGREFATAMNYVIGSIVAHDSRAGDRPDVLPDIERVVSAVELIYKRDGLEVAPFITWDEAVSGLESKGRPPFPRGSRNLEAAFGGGSRASSRSPQPARTDGRAVARAVEEMIREVTDAQDPYLFSRLLDKLIDTLDRLLTIEDAARVDYLHPLLGLESRGPLSVVSLNYDLGIEIAARKLGVNINDGVDSWGTEGLLNWPQHAVRLIKLHGSLSWARRDTRRDAFPGRMPVETVVPRDEVQGSPPFLVFGRREKLRAEGPFLQLLEAFRATLREIDDLIVVGYSFGDPHVNELIAQWVNKKDQARVVVVDPYAPEPNRWATDDFRSLLVRAMNGVPGRNVDVPGLRVVRLEAAEFFAEMGDDPMDFCWDAGTLE